MATDWTKLGAAAVLGAPAAKKPSTSTTAKANRAANPTTNYGNWTGESGSWYEPGTYSGAVAAATPRPAGFDDSAYNRLLFDQIHNANTGGAGSTGPPRQNLASGGSSGGRRGGGGGGGGAAAAPQLSQDQLNWFASLLQNGRPQAEAAGPALAMPEYKAPELSPFDTSQYDMLRTNFNSALASDQAAATGAYGNLTNYLQSNYRNPYANATYATSQNVPGQSEQAMQRMLASQGMSSGLANDAYRQGQSADQAFGNVLSLLGGNEDIAQRNRLGAVQMDANQTARALDMAGLQGRTGIDLQQSQAKNAWQQRADDRAYDAYNNSYNQQAQAALANWQRQNQLSDTNYQTNNAYTNSQMQAMLGLLPQLIGTNLSLPDVMAFLGGQQSTNV